MMVAGLAIVVAAQPAKEPQLAIEAHVEAPILQPIARAVEAPPPVEVTAPIAVEALPPVETPRARPRPSPTASAAPVVVPVAPVAPPPPSADERLLRALAQRGLDLADLAELADADTEIRRFRARPEDGLDAAIAAIDDARVPNTLLRKKLDRLAAALRAAAAKLPADELAQREKRYLDLETRLSLDPSNAERHAILADAVRLGRGLR